jgi:hypothetical protein
MAVGNLVKAGRVIALVQVSEFVDQYRVNYPLGAVLQSRRDADFARGR